MINNGFNIDEVTIPTNKTINITYNPHDISQYTYTVFKDGKVIDEKQVTKSASKFKLVETGKYKIQITRFEKNKQIIEETQELIVDKEAPKIDVINRTIQMTVDDTLNIMENVKATDNYDTKVQSKITSNYDELDFDTVGEKQVIYSVTDNAGNTSTQMVRVIVSSGFDSSIFFVQAGIFVTIIMAIVLVMKTRRSLMLEKRITPYTVKAVHDHSKSFFDIYSDLHDKEIKRIATYLKRRKIWDRIAKAYKSRIPITNYEYDEYDIFAEKILFGILFVLCALISETLKIRDLSIFEIFFSYVVGTIVPDITFAVKSKIYYDKLENDLLQAIIIMNNAFKSGRSITQAVSLVASELDGPIANEFEKMRVELSFGLDLSVVFSRFSERVNIEEAKYLTSSLTILNNTGGNIIKVFDSIEESLFDKKKIKLETEALTASSKIILYVLFVVPIIFVVMISVIDPSFFNPFFDSLVGIIFFGMIVVVYILYIMVLKKIMKVRV